MVLKSQANKSGGRSELLKRNENLVVARKPDRRLSGAFVLQNKCLKNVRFETLKTLVVAMRDE